MIHLQPSTRLLRPQVDPTADLVSEQGATQVGLARSACGRPRPLIEMFSIAARHVLIEVVQQCATIVFPVKNDRTLCVCENGSECELMP